MSKKLPVFLGKIVKARLEGRWGIGRVEVIHDGGWIEMRPILSGPFDSMTVRDTEVYEPRCRVCDDEGKVYDAQVIGVSDQYFVLLKDDDLAVSIKFDKWFEHLHVGAISLDERLFEVPDGNLSEDEIAALMKMSDKSAVSGKKNESLMMPEEYDELPPYLPAGSGTLTQSDINEILRDRTALGRLIKSTVEHLSPSLAERPEERERLVGWIESILEK